MNKRKDETDKEDSDGKTGWVTTGGGGGGGVLEGKTCDEVGGVRVSVERGVGV